jgi:hypothetical protein
MMRIFFLTLLIFLSCCSPQNSASTAQSAPTKVDSTLAKSEWTVEQADNAIESAIKVTTNEDIGTFLRKLRADGSAKQKLEFAAGEGDYHPPTELLAQTLVTPASRTCYRRICTKVIECSGENGGPPCTARAECQPVEPCTECRPNQPC